MTIQQCYEKLHGDYDQAKSRLMNDRLIDKFILKFPSDNSMEILRNAVEKGDIAESFRGAHTLKGVSANLAFTELQNAASELTEQLRPCSIPADPDLYAKVVEAYDLVIQVLKEYEGEKV